MENLNHSNSNITGMSLKEQVGTGVLGVCFLFGIPANIAVVVFLPRYLKKDNFTLHLMLNLAASDILRLLCVPLWIYNLFWAWALGRVFCKLLYLVVFISSYCSVLIVTLMSVQRYVMVLHRNQWTKLGSKGEKLLLISLWTLALILASPESAQADLADRENKVCTRTPDEVFMRVLLCETLLGFVLPFFVMAMFYFCLHKRIKQATLSGNPRLAKLVIAILFTFFVLGIPCHVMNLVRVAGLALSSSNPSVSQRLNSIWYSGTGVAKTLTVVNSCVNPLLYAWSFRRRSRSRRSSRETSSQGI